ncbi:hypothetical protein EJB05_31809, partial [Eragrostis curvula]
QSTHSHTYSNELIYGSLKPVDQWLESLEMVSLVETKQKSEWRTSNPKIARNVEVKPIRVYEVSTLYTMFNQIKGGSTQSGKIVALLEGILPCMVSRSLLCAGI